MENYSTAESFREILKEENNFLSNLKPESFRLLRRRMIETILATDISTHTKNLNTLKTKLDTFGVKRGKNVNNLVH